MNKWEYQICRELTQKTEDLERRQQRFEEFVDFCNEAEKLDMEHEASYEHETEPARIGGMVSAPQVLRLLGMNDSVDALNFMIEINKKRAENKAKAESDPQPAPELHTYDVNIGSMTIKKGHERRRGRDMMDVVRCKFGSIVQETAERLLPEWCSAEKCPARSSYECYYALLHIGINPMRPEDIRKEGQS